MLKCKENVTLFHHLAHSISIIKTSNAIRIPIPKMANVNQVSENVIALTFTTSCWYDFKYLTCSICKIPASLSWCMLKNEI